MWNINVKILRYGSSFILLVLAAVLMVGPIAAYSSVSESYRDYLWITAVPASFCTILAILCIGNWYPCNFNNGTRASEDSADSRDDESSRNLFSSRYPEAQSDLSGRPTSCYPRHPDHPIVHIINLNNDENEPLDSSGRFPFYATNYHCLPMGTPSGSADRNARQKNDDKSPSRKSATSSGREGRSSGRSSMGGGHEGTSLLKPDSSRNDGDDNVPNYGSTEISTGAKRKYPFPNYGITPKLPTPSPSPPKPVLQGIPITDVKRCRLSDIDTSEELEKNNTWPRDYVKSLKNVRRFLKEYYDPYTKKLWEADAARESELPINKTKEKVKEWLLTNPIIPVETQSKESENCSGRRRRRRRHLTDPGLQRQSSLKKVNKLSDSTEEPESSTKKDRPNRFCYLGKGYFYAVETDHYVPVESESRTESSDSTTDKEKADPLPVDGDKL